MHAGCGSRLAKADFKLRTESEKFPRIIAEAFYSIYGIMRKFYKKVMQASL